jgi:hypothetical protein
MPRTQIGIVRRRSPKKRFSLRGSKRPFTNDAVFATEDVAQAWVAEIVMFARRGTRQTLTIFEPASELSKSSLPAFT